KDIRALVCDKLGNDKELHQRHSRLEDRVDDEDKLMRGAGGMFHWAKCQLGAVAECFDLPSVEEALSSLSTSLGKTYKCILDSILGRYKSQAMRLP
ncbi:hypothetical protein K431DRAFT_229300, partial [Polychaeton citri CBS 116435]